jgi:hypothetical protein
MIHSDTWTCWEILHSGEGPRGKSHVTRHVHSVSPEAAAKFVAEELDDAEKRESGCSDSHLSGGERFIEVEIPAGMVPGSKEKSSAFFRVRTVVRRCYDATLHPSPEELAHQLRRPR